MRTLAVLLAMPLVVAACAAGSGDPPVAGESAGAPAAASLVTSGAAVPDGVPDEVWQAILSDIERRASADSGAVSVVSAEAVTWTDGSLGCPKDGEMYTQALVDGYHVVVEVDGSEFDYRVGSGTDVRLCEDPPIGG